MNDQKTHLRIKKEISGVPIDIQDDLAKVKLKLTKDMALDESGLIHGGFTFGLADYAAMLAINHPNVVLGGAQVRFVKPVKVGDILIAEAMVSRNDGKKTIVDVLVKRDQDVVFFGEFICFSPEKHVLDSE